MSDVMAMRYAGVNHANDMINVDKSQEFLGDEPHKFLGDESFVTNILASRKNEKGH